MNINQKFDAGPQRDLARITVSLLNDLVAAPFDQADAAADRAIRVLGVAGGFDRTYLFEIRDDTLLDNTHEWAAPGVARVMESLQGVPIGALGSWLDDFRRDRSVEIEQVAHLTPEHPARQMLIEQGIKSLLLVPLLGDGQLLGLLGYDAVRAPRRLNRDEVFLLRCASNGIAALFARRRAAAERDQATAKLRAALLEKDRAEKRFHDVAGMDVSELRHALERAEAGSRAKSVFLTAMNREIRTPLNGILGATELMQDLVESPRAMEWLGAIRDSGEALMRMLDDLLDISDLEAGALVLQDGTLNPVELAGRLEPIYALRAQDRGLEFAVRVKPAAIGPRRGDAARLMQILHHLLGNALKFTPRGTVSLQLEVPEPDWMRITVGDTGIGMDADELDRVWLPFERAGCARDRLQPGRGLGLTIVRSLVSVMGGRITIQSQPDAGTRVVLDLPLPRCHAADAALIAAQPVSPRKDLLRGRRPWAALSVLVADDNSINRLILKSMLEAIGIQADIANDGHEAVALWRTRRHELVLMDIAMPGMDGLSALTAINDCADRDGHPRPAAVAVTANALRPHLDDYLTGGFDLCVAKPVRRAELEAAIAAFWPKGD
ncbi:ATP-binding protein [Pararhodobacter sp. SW119]|uniref:ATP-binding protein n=1 Tax=Pararhodobacter sp. SW119 TaxID=2780075 RepID=UPI001AE069CB|nr:ATP-binding protein [Pararhodobacter sp. SW119]